MTGIAGEGLTVIVATTGRPSLGHALASARRVLPVSTILIAPSEDARLDAIASVPTVQVLPPTGGVYEAWNLAVSQCQTDHLIFVNDDDVFEGGALAPPVSESLLINLPFRRSSSGVRPTFSRQRADTWIHPMDLFHANRAGNINSWIWRRSLFDRFGPFDSTFRVRGDIDWMQRLIGVPLRVVWLDEPVYVQGRGPDRLSGWERDCGRLVEEARRVLDSIASRHGLRSAPSVLARAWFTHLRLRQMSRSRFKSSS